MGAIEPFQGPVFVVGMPRSGTKLLRDLMNQHPMIAIPPVETELLPRWADRWPSYGDLSDPAVFRAFHASEAGAAYFIYLREEHQLQVHADEWYAACRGHGLADVFEALVRQTVRVPSEGVWGDKSPGYVTRIPQIRRIWPHARFIHIIRDCRDYCLSMQSAWNKDPRRAAQRWADDVALALDAEQAAEGTVLRVHYEGLLGAPEDTMRGVLAHLGLDWDPACASLARPSENLGSTAGEARIVATNRDKWRQEMAPDLRASIEAIAGATLARAGYDVDQAGSERLSLAERRMAQVRDGFHLVRFDAAERGWMGALRFRWRIFRDSGAWEG